MMVEWTAETCRREISIKGTCSVWVLCSCGPNCRCLTSTAERCCPNNLTPVYGLYWNVSLFTQSQGSGIFGYCGRQSCMLHAYRRALRFCPVIIIPPTLHIHISFVCYLTLYIPTRYTVGKYISPFPPHSMIDINVVSYCSLTFF
jgi:hypothetical protein